VRERDEPDLDLSQEQNQM